MTELKPCPFCGGKAMTHDFSWHASQFAGHMFETPYWQVHCSECRAAIGDFETRAEAIEAWDTRAERTTTMTTDEDSQNWYSCDTCYADGYAAALPNYCPNCGARVVGGDAE